MSTLTKQELISLVSESVKEAMKLSAFTCPGCQATFTDPARYMDHRVGEQVTKQIQEAQKLDPEKILTECKDGICKIVDDHIKEKYKGAETEGEEAGLFSVIDDPE